VARGLGVDAVAALSEFAVDGVAPDLVVVLDVDDAVADRRRDGADRLEREQRAFHDQVRAAYRELAAAHGWRVVDGRGTIDDVAARVWEVVEVAVP
jgi:dTMP kinase